MQATVPQTELPNEMVLEIIEAAISNGIVGAIYPLICSCKHWNRYINNRIDGILQKYVTRVDTPWHQEPRGIAYALPCDVQSTYHELPSGLLHGDRRVRTRYPKGEEILTELYWAGTWTRFRTLEQSRPSGEMIVKTQKWWYGVKHGIYILDRGDSKSYRIETRTISMYNKGIKLNVSFEFNCYDLDDYAEVTTTMVTAAHAQHEPFSFEQAIEEIPPMDDFAAWDKFYIQLIGELDLDLD